MFASDEHIFGVLSCKYMVVLARINIHLKLQFNESLRNKYFYRKKAFQCNEHIVKSGKHFSNFDKRQDRNLFEFNKPFPGCSGCAAQDRRRVNTGP